MKTKFEMKDLPKRIDAEYINGDKDTRLENAVLNMEVMSKLVLVAFGNDIHKELETKSIENLKVAIAMVYRSLRYLSIELGTDLDSLLEFCENEKR